MLNARAFNRFRQSAIGQLLGAASLWRCCWEVVWGIIYASIEQSAQLVDSEEYHVDTAGEQEHAKNHKRGI